MNALVSFLSFLQVTYIGLQCIITMATLYSRKVKTVLITLFYIIKQNNIIA